MFKLLRPSFNTDVRPNLSFKCFRLKSELNPTSLESKKSLKMEN